MARTAYYLTEDDVAVLRRVIEDHDKANERQARYRPTVGALDRSPEVYVARTPIGGIPALTEEVGAGIVDTPGSAACSIYQIQDNGSGTFKLYPASTGTFTVYNLSLTAVPASTWVKITRDKYGRWIVDLGMAVAGTTSGGGDPFTTGTSTSTSDGVYLQVVTDVCLVHSGGVYSIVVEKTPVFLPSNTIVGTPVCTTNPMSCCSDSTGTGTADPDGGAGDDAVDNSCCSNIPRTLYATASGGCTNTITLTYNEGSGTWVGSGMLGLCSVTLTLSCSSGVWTLAVSGAVSWSGPLTGTCIPFSWTTGGLPRITFDACCLLATEITVTD